MTTQHHQNNGGMAAGQNNNIPPTPTKVVNSTGIFKKFMPMTAFFVAFFLVMTLLLIYMDNTGKN